MRDKGFLLHPHLYSGISAPHPNLIDGTLGALPENA
jgi:hypothetical protein